MLSRIFLFIVFGHGIHGLRMEAPDGDDRVEDLPEVIDELLVAIDKGNVDTVRAYVHILPQHIFSKFVYCGYLERSTFLIYAVDRGCNSDIVKIIADAMRQEQFSVQNCCSETALVIAIARHQWKAADIISSKMTQEQVSICNDCFGSALQYFLLLHPRGRSHEHHMVTVVNTLASRTTLSDLVCGATEAMHYRHNALANEIMSVALSRFSRWDIIQEYTNHPDLHTFHGDVISWLLKQEVRDWVFPLGKRPLNFISSHAEGSRSGALPVSLPNAARNVICSHLMPTYTILEKNRDILFQKLNRPLSLLHRSWVWAQMFHLTNTSNFREIISNLERASPYRRPGRAPTEIELSAFMVPSDSSSSSEESDTEQQED